MRERALAHLHALLEARAAIGESLLRVAVRVRA